MLRQLDMARAWRGRFGVYGALVTLTTVLAGWGAVRLFEHGIDAAETALRIQQGAQPAANRAPATEVRGQLALLQADWHERLRSKDFWSGKAGPGAPMISRVSLGGPPPPPPRNGSFAGDGRDQDGEPTYRTVCVRLCDGYFWPISFATTDDNFKRDRQACEKSCGSPAKLYVYRNPGGDIEDMRDLDGQPYTRLKTANLFRTTYQASCKCKADPWEQEAKDQHRLYALDAARRKGDKVAAKEAVELRAKLEASRRQAQRGPVAAVSQTTVVAATTTTVEERVLQPAPALQPQAKPATRNGGSPGASRAAGAPSRSAASSGGGRSGASGSSARWQNEVFRGN